MSRSVSVPPVFTTEGRLARAEALAEHLADECDRLQGERDQALALAERSARLYRSALARVEELEGELARIRGGREHAVCEDHDDDRGHFGEDYDVEGRARALRGPARRTSPAIRQAVAVARLYRRDLSPAARERCIEHALRIGAIGHGEAERLRSRGYR